VNFIAKRLAARQQRIHDRRDVKRAATGLIIDVARQFPAAAWKGNSVHQEFELAAAMFPLFEWYRGLTGVQKTVLETAKGCTRRPRDAGYDYLTTFGLFLRFGLEEPSDNICYASWLRNALLWAHQIRQENPQTFPADDTPNILDEIRTAWDRQFAGAHGL
jgi:hypothetical protein